ncbi:hypothetical protein [Flammeovirga pacifica]|uniref:Uncharacterized protein n=1 Tax=Flammeovirga pacifica TaxID=915059 RepID=A0A1S1YXL9_FLAPC|nr:hypothetical protein [Flammeovirga pacifica]OHX65752.1 hypothetical protein NH26_05000 [Flammeovirga pacifica]
MALKKTKAERDQDFKHRWISIFFTTLVTIGILILAWYTIVWSPPDPPIPQYGIEVAFGMDDAGFGNTKSETPFVEDNDVLDDPKPSEPTPEPTPEETIEETVEEVVEDIPEEVPTEETPTNEPEAVTDQEVETPVPVTEKPVIKKEEKKEQIEKPKEEVKKEKPKPKTPQNVMGPVNSTGVADQQKSNNKGNVEGAQGNQGTEKGTLNSDTQMKSDGGSGGSALSMPGWNWLEPPSVNDRSSATGKIIIDIQVDEYGDVIALKTVFRSVPRTVVLQYEDAVRNLSFAPNRADADIEGITNGSITFILRNK